MAAEVSNLASLLVRVAEPSTGSDRTSAIA